MKAIARKLSRLRAGSRARVMDLFAGCGGLSLGAQAAGCDVLGAVEIDPLAALSHARNFHAGLSGNLFAAHAASRDITTTDPSDLLRELDLLDGGVDSQVDVLIGGPPCQAFARVGRAKLREIREHPEAFLHDERSGLYRHYIRFIEELRPVAVVIENVPDVLNYGGLNLFETIAGSLSALGYEARYTLLNAAHYGVPQMRTRCFLLALARDAKVVPEFPSATHTHLLPVGYQGTRDVALRAVTLFDESNYVDPAPATCALPRATTVRDAIGDLPPLTGHLDGTTRKQPQRFDRPVPATPAGTLAPYAKLMRYWPGFASDGLLTDHVIRHLPRDYRLFARMRPGDQYPEAHALALRLRDEEVARRELETGERIRRDSATFRRLTAEIVPPYDPTKFPNKWRKMAAEEPARTLMAHIGKDTYSHIHYDSLQARTISVREAARLQSFPDGFRFAGTMNPAFRQIGNAVPPLLAYALVRKVLQDLAPAQAEIDRLGGFPGLQFEGMELELISSRG